MDRHFRLCTRFLLVLLFVSCTEDRTLNRLDHIRHVGNSDPITALAMLDSLEIEMRTVSDYTRNKYDLLRIRLNDKADKTATSDIVIKSLVSRPRCKPFRVLAQAGNRASYLRGSGDKHFPV